MSTLTIEVAKAFKPLRQKARYKAAHGGRGGGKSHDRAEDLILTCYVKQTRAVCIREVQNSIRDSVRQLLVDKIQKFGLGQFFEVTNAEIRGRNGSLIVFRGMQSYNAENIKSLEDFDIAWVEEAQTLSEKSLRLLRPTIRKEGSEVWFTWNPRYESDPVDQFFRGANPPKDSVIVSVNLDDNPWATQVLKDERDEDYARDEEMAEHVWGGGYEIVSEAAYYARLISRAEKEGRIGEFPYDPAYKVRTSWDIGIDDYTAIWFWQFDGEWHTAIDYYEVSGLGLQDIRDEALPELIPDIQKRVEQRKFINREKPYKYASHFFPHDIKVREWGNAGRSRVEVAKELGLWPIHKGTADGPRERIEATRNLLPKVRFNRTSNVMLGVNRLRRYSRRLNEQMQIYTAPLHDENSHGADAFGEYAVNASELTPPVRVEKPKQRQGTIVLDGPPAPSSSTRIAI